MVSLKELYSGHSTCQLHEEFREAFQESLFCVVEAMHAMALSWRPTVLFFSLVHSFEMCEMGHAVDHVHPSTPVCQYGQQLIRGSALVSSQSRSEY